MMDRIERERLFHDNRVASNSENRDAQQKYYFAVAPCYENFAARITKQALGKDVLEYGCFTGDKSLSLATSAHTVTGIDISEAAIATATQQATLQRRDNAFFHAMNAESLSFADNSFDFIFGTGILHHLDLNRAYQELSRVLRPNGVALFIEPLGHNPVINAYRHCTPDARTDDEHPLLRKDIRLAHEYFSSATIQSAGLLTLGVVPLGQQKAGRIARDFLTVADKILLKMPILKWQAWIAVLELRR